jgi:hypothetical protein
MGWAGNFWHGAERWLQVEQELHHVLGLLSDERVLHLQYEQLLAEPVAIEDFEIGGFQTRHVLIVGSHHRHRHSDQRHVGDDAREIVDREDVIVSILLGDRPRGREGKGQNQN